MSRRFLRVTPAERQVASSPTLALIIGLVLALDVVVALRHHDPSPRSLAPQPRAQVLLESHLQAGYP
jgi:hypothetical protein